MKKIILLSAVALFTVACAKKPEPVPVAQPIEPEPVYDGKLS